MKTIYCPDCNTAAVDRFDGEDIVLICPNESCHRIVIAVPDPAAFGIDTTKDGWFTEYERRTSAYTDEWIEARLDALAEGDSNDEEIDTLREIVAALQEERRTRA